MCIENQLLGLVRFLRSFGMTFSGWMAIVQSFAYANFLDYVLRVSAIYKLNKCGANTQPRGVHYSIS